jgi:hypothetical protein
MKDTSKHVAAVALSKLILSASGMESIPLYPPAALPLTSLSLERYPGGINQERIKAGLGAAKGRVGVKTVLADYPRQTSPTLTPVSEG